MGENKETINVTMPLSFEIEGRMDDKDNITEKWSVRLIPAERNIMRRESLFFLEIRPLSPLRIPDYMITSSKGGDLSDLVELMVKEKIGLFTYQLCRKCLERRIKEMRKSM